MNNRREPESLQDEARDIHEEARMVLPGVQTLFGFQLIAAFNTRFTELDATDRIVHLVSLLLVTLAIGLIMTPAALHRTSERNAISAYFVNVASNLIAIAMTPLLIAISLDVYVVCRLATDGRAWWPAIVTAGAVFATLALLWVAFPLWRRARGSRREATRGAPSRKRPR